MVVLDPTLIGVVDFTEGIKDNGVLVVNTTGSPSALRKKLGLDGVRVFTVDATRIAMDTIGRNIPNTPIIGALIKATGAVGKENVREEIKKRMGAKTGKKMAEANIAAFERAYDEVKEG